MLGNYSTVWYQKPSLAWGSKPQAERRKGAASALSDCLVRPSARLQRAWVAQPNGWRRLQRVAPWALNTYRATSLRRPKSRLPAVRGGG